MELGLYQRDEHGRRFYSPRFPLPHIAIDDVFDTLRMAQCALTELDKALSNLSDVNAIGLLVRLEAVESSAAEGTTSTFTELVSHEAAETHSPQASSPIENSDVESVKAIVDSFPETLKNQTRAISPIRRARMIHGMLFPREASSKWMDFPLGDYKRFANATTDEHEPMGLFHYAQPANVKDLMLQWQDQTVGRNEDRKLDPLIRQALSHWLFEHIHPFADGNGRVGRLLTPIMLWRQEATAFPCAFYGEPVRQNKMDYIEALKKARRHSDLGIWVRYFCFLIEIGARENKRRIEALSGIMKLWREELKSFRSDSLVHSLLPHLISSPIIGVRNVMNIFPDCSFNTANTALQHCVRLGIIQQLGAQKRDRVFANIAVLDLFDTKRRK